MNNYQPDQLETAIWNILQPLINVYTTEALRLGYQSAGEWGDNYCVMSVTSRQPQGQDETLAFNEDNSEFFYKGQRNGQVSVTFVGPRHGERAENLVSRLKTETGRDLIKANKVVMFNPQVLSNVPVQDKERWLQGAAVVVNYRVAYTYSDSVGIIEIVDLTANVNEVQIHKTIDIKAV